MENDLDLPIATRRKRRASSSLSSPQKDPAAAAGASSISKGSASAADHQRHHDLRDCPSDGIVVAVARTPSKPRTKKVRFSDPGPDLRGFDLESTSDAGLTTGLTPFIRRTSLAPCLVATPPSLLSRPPRRRASTPSLQRAAASKPGTAVVLEFTPLREVLSDRCRRRLRRNHLSETMNDFEAELREKARRSEEILRLKRELALAKRQIEEAERITDGSSKDATESTNNNEGSEQRIEELEQEVVQLKEQLQDQFAGVDPDIPTPGYDNDDAVSLVGGNSYRTAGEDFTLVDTPPETPLTPTAPNTPFSMVDAYPPLFDTPSRTRMTSTCTQTETGNGSDDNASALDAFIAAQTAQLVNARLELEHVCAGEVTLPLRSDHGDPMPLVGAMLTRLRAAKSVIERLVRELSTAETSQAILNKNFNAALQQTEGSRAETSRARADHAKQQARGDAYKRAATERQRSIESLSAALGRYRSEAKELEGLITRAEEEGNARVGALRIEMAQTVADLEAAVAAETGLRREAEAELERRGLRIRELERHERELKEAIWEKQRALRALEDSQAAERAERAQEVGGLNVRIGELAGEVEGLQSEVERCEGEKRALMSALGDERVASARALEELKRVAQAYDDGIQARGQSIGLLTPEMESGRFCTPKLPGGRFRDVASESVEGAVEQARGSKRGRRQQGQFLDRDIGILSEEIEPESEL